jgi:hypothetical protein
MTYDFDDVDFGYASIPSGLSVQARDFDGGPEGVPYYATSNRARRRETQGRTRWVGRHARLLGDGGAARRSFDDGVARDAPFMRRCPHCRCVNLVTLELVSPAR